MTSKPAKSQQRGSTSSDRRSNLELRALIDEMLERVRDLSRHGDEWTAEKRARAEAELDAVMARVRRSATQRRDS